MILAEIRTGVRNITKEWSTDAGTLLPSDNTILDMLISWAAEDVVLDLVSVVSDLQSVFLGSENITLIASQANYSLTAEWLQIYCIQRNVTNENPEIIPYIPVDEKLRVMYIGETAVDPEGFYLVGSTIYFVPTPSTAKTSYATVWFIRPEAATIPTAGPTYIPRIAHKLIVLRTAILISKMNDQADIGGLAALYQNMLDRVTDVLGYRVQSQPTFLKSSFSEKQISDTRDKAFYDKSNFFD